MSVVVPIYGVEQWLERCVESILDQTHSALNVILVDDGSPDGCPGMCDAYALRDHRVTVIHQENRGLSAARNAGLHVAQGRFVTFVDSDDWLHERFVEELVRAALDAPGSVVVSDFEKATGDVPRRPSREPRSISLSPAEALVRLHSDLYVRLVVAWGKLYPLSLFSEIRFPEGRIHEDEFTTHRVLGQASQVVLVQSSLYFYFIRPDSIMATQGGLALTDTAAALEERIDFLYAEGYVESYGLAMRKLAYVYVALMRYARFTGESDLLRETRRKARLLCRQMKSRVVHRVRLELLAYTVFPRVVDGLRSLTGRSIDPPAAMRTGSARESAE